MDIYSNEEIKFKEFTQDSFVEIRKRIENVRVEQGLDDVPSVKQSRNPLKRIIMMKKKKKSKPLDMEYFKRPRPEFMTGATLPEQYDFPNHLIGKPIEEIDDFYKNEYVLKASIFNELKFY